MTLLVTGGVGFIGSCFTHFMLAKYPDLRIICLDRMTYAANPMTLEGLRHDPNFRFVKGDIADSICVDRLFEEEHPDAVVHFAAESHVDRSIEDPSVFLKTNVIGTGVLLDACRKYGIGRFHQVSTDEVYGALPLNKKEPFTEESPLSPSSPYAASKASADLLVMAYRRTYGIPVTISRASNNYGPRQYPEKLIPLMLANALHGEKLPLYGGGWQVRDWLYVEDHVRAIDLILDRGREGEIYNVGGSCEMPNIDVVKKLCKRLSVSEDRIVSVSDRPGHDVRYALSYEKLQKELGWYPATSFEEGFEKTVRWYLDNRSWWESTVGDDYHTYYQTIYGKK